MHKFYHGNFVNKVKVPSSRQGRNNRTVDPDFITAIVKVHPRFFDVGGCESVGGWTGNRFIKQHWNNYSNYFDLERERCIL